MVTIFCIGSILWSSPWYLRITYIFAPFNYVGLMKRSIYALQFVNVQNCRMGKCVNKVHDQRFTALRSEMHRIIESLRQTLLFLESFAILYILYIFLSSKNILFHWSTPIIRGMTLQLRALFNLYAHAPSQLWDYMFRKKKTIHCLIILKLLITKDVSHVNHENWGLLGLNFKLFGYAFCDWRYLYLVYRW